jgi:hypothetical protein
MGDLIRISAKNLGAVALADFCQRCFWIKLRMRHRLPYQIFPGIFSSIDSYSKRIVHRWFDTHGEPPPWLADLGPLVGYREPPHHSAFRIVDQEHQVLITGNPDGVFARPNGSHVIADYKTAKRTPTQDRLYPLYEAQLNAYARIGEACGLRPVSGLALVYTEPMTDPASSSGENHHRDDGFAMDFAACVVDVPLDTAMLRPLLARTRAIYGLPAAPPGREGCPDCKLLDGLVDVVKG